MTVAIRGNSIYSLIFKVHPRSENPGVASSLTWWSWGDSNKKTYRDQLFSLSNEYSGSIATINSQEEYDYLEFSFKDQVSYSAWVYLPGEILGVANFRKSHYSEWGEASDYQEWFPADSFSGYAPEFAVVETPLNLSITTSSAPAEGAGVFTTSINLSADSETSGNLAEDAEVYWAISGITEDDLESGVLEGSGVITDGVLEIEHSLAEDNDSGESFDVSVDSDADRTQQIGATGVFEVKDTITSIGPSGESLTLSGNDYDEPWQYVVIEDSPSLSISGEYTVSSWVYRSKARGDWRNLYDIPNGHLLEFSPSGGFDWRSENNNIDFNANGTKIPGRE